MDEEDLRHNVIESSRRGELGPGVSYEAQVTRDTRTDVTTLHLYMRHGKAMEYYRLARKADGVTIDEYYVSALLLIGQFAPHLKKAFRQSDDCRPFLPTLDHILLMHKAQGRPC